MMIPVPTECILYPLFAILIYSVALKGGPIFDDMEVLPNAEKYVWKWSVMRKSARPISSFLLALQMQWPKTLRGVHAMNCWIHALNAFLVERSALSLGVDPIQSLACGLFFVALPFAANTVAYMSGQANLLATTFGLLGSLAILSHHPWFSLPCLLFAYLSKEDGLGFAATFVFLALWQSEWWAVTGIIALILGAAIIQRKHLKTLLKNRGDKEMSAIGLPVSYPQPRHFFVVLAATLWRIPCWALGLKQSPYHGSGIKRW